MHNSNNSISIKSIIRLHSVIVFTWLIIMFDYIFLSSGFKNVLPGSPDQITLLFAVFTLPHIVTGFITFADKEYLISYKKLLFIAFATAYFGLIIASIFGAYVFAAIFTFFTVFHVVSQQTGITRLITPLPHSIYRNWRFSLIFFSFFLYLMLLNETGSQILLISGSTIFGIISTFFFSRLFFLRNQLMPRIYICCTQLLAVSSLLMFFAGYPLFAILVPRIVHDVTAFIIYQNHDINRHKMKKNYIYSPLSKLMSPKVAGPFLGVTIGSLAMWMSTKSPDIQMLIMLMFLMHYFLESFIWRKSTPHRLSLISN